ncbi:MAG: hypothetical protein PVJ39_14395 [Gammaproteobacteria bacterium]
MQVINPRHGMNADRLQGKLLHRREYLGLLKAWWQEKREAWLMQCALLIAPYTGRK